jgi:hypothetical protein
MQDMDAALFKSSAKYKAVCGSVSDGSLQRLLILPV